MINLTSEQINTAFEKLPDEVILAMNKINLDSRIKEFCDQNELDENITNNINFLANLRIVKLIDENELEEEIKNSTDNPSVREKIISSIKEILNLLDKEIRRKKELAEILSQEITGTEEDIRFDVLPQTVQEAISLSGWQESLLEIAKENKLNIEQSGILEDITIKTMKNEISHSDYPSKISSLLRLDNETSSKIVSSVAEKIFNEIRNIMRELEDDTDDNLLDVPLPPYTKENRVEDNEVYHDEPPKPPYAETDTLEEKQGFIEGNEELFKNNVKEVLSDKTMTSNIGGIQSHDFSIPKTQINNDNKDITEDSVDMPSKINHDPYREII